MTRRPEPGSHDQAAHRWLAQHQDALTHALDDLLDVEAGLREILISSRHDTATDNLDTVLDTEAGLAAILPITAHTPPPSTHDAPHDHTSTEGLFRELSPADRMALRNDPDVKAASQALARFRDLERGVAFDLDRARDLALDLARELNRELAIDLNRTQDLIRAVGLDRGMALNLDRARDLARDLESDFDRWFDEFDHLDRPGLEHSLSLARKHARYLDRGLADAVDRAHAVGFDLAIDLTSVRDLARDFIRAVDLVDDLSPFTRIHVLTLDQAGDVFVDVRAAEVRRAIGRALYREPPALDEDSLCTLLDDFTTADLSDADLTGIDLNGVHWSERGTQWPPAVGVDDLKARSDEAPPGSGTWIVRSGTTTIRDLAEL